MESRPFTSLVLRAAQWLPPQATPRMVPFSVRVLKLRSWRLDPAYTAVMVEETPNPSMAVGRLVTMLFLVSEVFTWIRSVAEAYVR